MGHGQHYTQDMSMTAASPAIDEQHQASMKLRLGLSKLFLQLVSFKKAPKLSLSDHKEFCYELYKSTLTIFAREIGKPMYEVTSGYSNKNRHFLYMELFNLSSTSKSVLISSKFFVLD